jgi:(p)ppGpp synthase/HD superfamily hydrolase
VLQAAILHDTVEDTHTSIGASIRLVSLLVV